jgi:hypothetical protein
MGRPFLQFWPYPGAALKIEQPQNYFIPELVKPITSKRTLFDPAEKQVN